MKKKHSPEQIVKKLQEADGLRAGGMTVPDACRQLEISVATYHQWRNRKLLQTQRHKHRLSQPELGLELAERFHESPLLGRVHVGNHLEDGTAMGLHDAIGVDPGEFLVCGAVESFTAVLTCTPVVPVEV